MAGKMSYADLQKMKAANAAREAAYNKATSVESRAAVARAARGLAPRDPSKPAYTMDDYRRDFPSKKPVAPSAPRPAAPSGGAAAPVSGMGGAGGTQQMIKKGGMTKGSGRDGCAIRGKTRA